MTRLARSQNKDSAGDLTLLTVALIGFGFIAFYFGSQMVTAEDAHLIHWGSAFGGAVAGWLIGLIAEKIRHSGSQ